MTAHRKSDPGRLEAMKNTPKDVMINPARREVVPLLFDKGWPDFPKVKLSHYVTVQK